MCLTLGCDIPRRPMFYTVSPNVSDPEATLLMSRRITPLKSTYEEFLVELDKRITSPFRVVVRRLPEAELPISERFVVERPGLHEECRDFLEQDVEYIRPNMPVEKADPKLFYKGYSQGWGPMQQNLDVRRRSVDTILDLMLQSPDLHRKDESRFLVVTGHAGSGKSTIMRRTAWDAAASFEALCLHLRPHGTLRFESLRELCQLIDQGDGISPLRD